MSGDGSNGLDTWRTQSFCSNLRPSRGRLEVRPWTAEQKAGIVAESYGGGETVSAVARRHGLTPQQLFAGAASGAAGGSGSREGRVTFAPVIVDRHGMLADADCGGASGWAIAD
jgi:transposase-like protein